ncbi:MAG TPA: hypothetical protein VFQ87_08160, partial [Bradyrhizobium sp.]|nr:hypothetical protein [Bradyrhizobium sp.]
AQMGDGERYELTDFAFPPMPLAIRSVRPYLVLNGTVDALQLRGRDDHGIIGLRRMYARLLFVVVGIFRVVLAVFPLPSPSSPSRLGMTRTRRYTLAHE